MSRYRFVPCDKLIARTARVFKLNTNEWIGEAVEAVGEFIDLVGHKKVYKKVYRYVHVHNHLAEMPCDLKYLVTIIHNGVKLDVNSSTDHEEDHQHQSNYSGTYSHQDNYIKVPCKNGKVKMIYYKYIVDQQGMPMIPDNTKFIDGLSWYLVYQLILGGFVHPVVDIKMAMGMHEKTLAMAKNSISFPSPDEMQEMFLNNSMIIFDGLEDKTFPDY